MTRRTQTVTLEEVARAARVSRATVSRVVNGSPKVSDAARRAVEAAVAELGYVPNRAARSLATRRADAVGLVVAESETRVFGEPFFAALVRGVSSALGDSGVPLVLSFVRAEQDPAVVARYLGAHVDGALLVSVHERDPLLAHLEAAGIPTVLSGRPPRPVGLPYVDADNLGGARAAVAHLLARGRRRIATIAGPQDMTAGTDRLTGYRRAFEEEGVDVDESLIEMGDFSTGSGERAMATLLERVRDLDAVFAASDLMAVGAIRVLELAGRRVPDDVAVVGFDDSVIAETSRPRLTSVHQPVEAIGRTMIGRLRELQDGGRQGTDVATVLPTHLVVRASS